MTNKQKSIQNGLIWKRRLTVLSILLFDISVIGIFGLVILLG